MKWFMTVVCKRCKKLRIISLCQMTRLKYRYSGLLAYRSSKIWFSPNRNMGGDGGVVATQRRFMRGAKTPADSSDTNTSVTTSKNVRRQQEQRAHECAISSQVLPLFIPLFYSESYLYLISLYSTSCLRYSTETDGADRLLRDGQSLQQRGCVDSHVGQVLRLIFCPHQEFKRP